MKNVRDGKCRLPRLRSDASPTPEANAGCGCARPELRQPDKGRIEFRILGTSAGLSEGEVERIWLPFSPWEATGVIGLHEPAALRRRWPAVQAAAAVNLQLALLSPW